MFSALAEEEHALDLAPDLASRESAARLGVIYGGWAAVRKRCENTVLIGVPLLGAVITPFWFFRHPFGWIEAAAFLFSYAVVGFGVGIGLHRYFSHRSFRARPWLGIALGIAGSMAFQGSVLRWVADHRRHHAATDRCGDLHSPNIDSHCRPLESWRGLLHAHFGWMFDDSVTQYDVYAKDLLNDPQIMFFHRTQWVWPTLLLLSLWCFGFFLGGVEHAWGCFLFAGCFRTAFFHNVVWAVNSVGHTYGYQSYPLKNNSKNNPLLAWLTFGEGWHNNHHRFPRSAFHGLTPAELDVSGMVIRGLERIGWVSDVIRVPASQMTRPD
jgi:stearoyl-CoA desaturase (delta-9 desaturase)